MEEGKLMDKKYSGFEDNDYDDMFSDSSSSEHKFSASENEEDYNNSISDFCDTSIMTTGGNEMFSQEQANNLDTIKNASENADLNSDNVQEILKESVKNENVLEEDKVKYTSKEERENEEKQKESDENKRKMIIEGKEIIINAVDGATEEIEKCRPKDPRVREYKNVAVMPKASFAKPSAQGSGLKKIFFFIIACCSVGICFGVEANSYYNYMGGKTNGVMSCAFSWLTVENLPVSLSPLDTATFFGAFCIGAGILGVIGLFIWLDSDAKKRSRVGHEHGSSHLGSSRDFKTYKNKFMEK